MQQYGQDYWIPRDFELPGMRRATHRIEDCTIAAQGTDSDAVDLRGYGIIGLILPTLTGCNLTFETSEIEAGTYVPIHDNTGAAETITAGTGDRGVAADDLSFLDAYRWIKVISSESQGAERILHFIVKG